MESKRKQPQGFSGGAKLLLVLLVLVVLGGGYFGMQARGDTKLGITLDTNPVLNDQLELHHTFDALNFDLSQTNEFRDSSGNGRHGNWVGSGTGIGIGPGSIGQAYHGDGVNDYITIAHDIDFNLSTTSAAITFWYKHNDGDNSSKELLGHDQSSQGYRIFFSSGAMNFLHYGTDSLSLMDNNFSDDKQWHHFAIVFPGAGSGTGVLYRDGVSIDTDTYSGLIDRTIQLVIGAGRNGVNKCFCSVDDFRLYRRELTVDEIERLYLLGATSKINKTLTVASDLDNGLVGHWTLDGEDIVNNVVDRSGQGNTGYLLSGFVSTTTLPGRIGQGLDFDGTNDVLDIANSSSSSHVLDFTTGPFSMGAWFKADAVNGTIIGKRDGISDVTQYQMYIYDITGNLRLHFGAESSENVYATNTIIALGEWYHGFVTVDASNNPKIYINGVEEEIANETGSPPFSFTHRNVNVSIGARYNTYPTGAFLWNGILDDVRMYNRELSASEIQRLYALGATSKINKTLPTQPDLENGLVGHWTFDGSDMYENAADRSSSGNDGYLLSGFTSTTTVPGKIGQGLDFDGINDAVDIAGSNGSSHSLDFTNGPFSMGAWFKADAVNGTIIAKRDGISDNRQYQLYTHNITGNLRLHFGGESSENLYANDTIIQPGEWYHGFVVVDASNNPQIYINGVAASQSNETGTPPYTFSHRNVNVALGARYETYPSTEFRWDGALDDIRMYNRALSADEVQRLYRMGI